MKRPARAESLDALLEGVRDELHGWTDAATHDPGLALVELFGYLGEVLSQYAELVAAEGHLGSRRAARSVRVEVEGEPWTRVRSFLKSGPDDAHYVVRVGEGGASVIEFGDGEHGRRPPTGGVVRAINRVGSRYVAVELQQGRVILDDDWNEPAGAGSLRPAATRDVTPKRPSPKQPAGS
jgi:hypothetical protein